MEVGMRKILYMIIIAMGVLALAACGAQSTPTPAALPTNTIPAAVATQPGNAEVPTPVATTGASGGQGGTVTTVTALPTAPPPVAGNVGTPVVGTGQGGAALRCLSPPCRREPSNLKRAR